ncbi:long-chain acyl-CoA synthetase [Tistlia consotensis]|uniref:Long-chain acyl-CoA synthetase n=1 Tax=Tistlia consotensis USBA 355 TaxID=560819 RepID=A0A1Y6BDK5_9PROT|nr:AMP-binding protein [Tistlia consotensis]SMF04520.1 long-chain acyl-CoA synthetase [Tistlia consotensis USBA 355]SNR54536.1 long-chain acyl-CoA synthetase [Tistlia consotensis]
MLRDTALFERSTLPGLLRFWAERHPERLAFREKDLGVWQRWSFRDYYEGARDFALGLAALGVGPGDFLAVASEDTPEWMLADLAIQGLGGACIGIYPTNPWPELRYILEHSGARVVVCGDQEQTDKVLDAIRLGGELPKLEKIVCVDMKGMSRYPRDRLLSFEEVSELGRSKRAELGRLFEDSIERLSPDDVAVIVYTSGTTGMPKGAMLTHGGLIWGGLRLSELHGVDEANWEVLCYLPLCHVAERLCSTVMQLVNGTPVNFAESIDTVVPNLREIAPSGFLGVPRIWEKLQYAVMVKLKDATPLQQRVVARCLALGRPLARRRLAAGGELQGLRDRLLFVLLWILCFRPLQKWMGLDRGRTLLCGGASISPEVLEFFWTLGLRVYQVYGMTELSGISHSQYPGHTALGQSGPPLPSYEQRIAGDGEILVRSRSVFAGYLHNPEATAAAVSDGWMHTGDVGEIAPDGSIVITDRKKDIIITSGGKNITPSLIENRLKDSLYIREAVLIGERRNFLSALIQIDYETVGKWAQEQGFAYTTFKSLVQLPDVRELIAHEVETVNREFARVENIRRFTLLDKELDHDDGEVTATMKVRRRVIEEKYKPLIDAMYGG